MYQFNTQNNFIQRLLNRKNPHNPLYLLGAGYCAEYTYNTLKKYNIAVKGAFTTDNKKISNSLFDVYTYNELLEKEPSFDTIIAYNRMCDDCYPYSNAVLERKGEIFDIGALFFNNGFWNENFIKENLPKLKDTFNLLEDEYSKKVFNAYAKARFEGDLSKLIELSTSPQFFNDIVSYKNDHTLLDCGAFDGDTIEEFLLACNNQYKHIYAFEPEDLNYEKLSHKFGSNSQITLLKKGTWNKSTTLSFSDHDKASKVVEESEYKIEVIALDEISYDFLPGKLIIKADIEGSELEMLKGAKNLIANEKPQLAVCVYHRHDDLITIPQFIHSLRKDYKFYLRHHTKSFSQTVLYAV